MAQILIGIIGVFISFWVINLIVGLIRLRPSDVKQRLIIISIVTFLSLVIITRNLILIHVPMDKILDGATFYLYCWFPLFIFYVLRLKEKQSWLFLLYAIVFDLIIFLGLTILIMYFSTNAGKITYIENIVGLISVIIGIILSFVLVIKQRLPFTKIKQENL